MTTVCSKSNASSKTWTPLPDRFIDDHLVEMFPLFDGDAENAGLEYAGPEYAAPNCRDGICRTGKYGTNLEGEK